MNTRILILSALLTVTVACSENVPDETTSAAGAESVAEAAPEVVALPRTPSMEGASVFFITPTNGATVSNPITIEFGIAGMDVVKAGDNQPNSGHHHLLIDTGLPDLGLPIPADAQHVHFGDGSTSTEITLESGEHTLQMLLGDHLHIPHNPPLASEVITVNVE
jgi:hypothetical protein